MLKTVEKTKSLIDQKHLSEFSIKALVLKYPSTECSSVCRKTYHEQTSYILAHEARMKFITNLAASLNGNTLILFRNIEEHGDKLFSELSGVVATDRKVFYVHGGVSAEKREEIRGLVEKEKDVIIVASYGVFAVGINIKNLHNIIFAHPIKSKIRTLQSIGRLLRVANDGGAAVLYDIVDDLSHKSKKNFAVEHFVARHNYYTTEGFPVKIYRMNLK